MLRIDQKLSQKTSLNKFKRMEIIPNSFKPQQYESRNQLQREKWEKNKHVET